MDILNELKAVTGALTQEHIDYALCGGLAMAIYGLPRATLDVDLLIPFDALFSAKRALEPLGYTLSGAPMAFHNDAIQIYRLVKIATDTGEEMVLDLLLVTPAITSAWESRRDITWDGQMIKVVSVAGMMLLKSFRRSGKDLDDIEHLRNLGDET